MLIPEGGSLILHTYSHQFPWSCDSLGEGPLQLYLKFVPLKFSCRQWQGKVRLFLGHFQGWVLQTFQCLSTPCMENLVLLSNLSLPWHSPRLLLLLSPATASVRELQRLKQE